MASDGRLTGGRGGACSFPGIGPPADSGHLALVTAINLLGLRVYIYIRITFSVWACLVLSSAEG